VNAPATVKAHPVSRLGRSDRTALGRWFWTIDRVLLLMVFILICFGLIAVAAASPAAAFRYSGGSHQLGQLYYFKRQVLWVILGLPVMLGVSMLSRKWALRLSLAGAGIFTVLLALVPFVGHEANGAHRWIGAGSFQIQPSEFLKPLFIVTTAWLLALGEEDRTLPTMKISAATLAIVAVLLVQQPDIGQTALFSAVWLVQAVLAGLSLQAVGGLVALGITGLSAAYLFVPHVTSRIDRFLTGGGDTYQIDRALDAFRAGGLFGAGPGEGSMKLKLPEPHTDYIFAVIGEEFGAIACLALAALFVAIVVRVLVRLLDEEDPFLLFASAGLVTQFGLQALINMSVNLNLLPSKGMTLPFISHGGSSMIALCMGMGLLLAFTRRNAYLKRSPYVGGWKE
jgi:cell division protein FtsW